MNSINGFVILFKYDKGKLYKSKFIICFEEFIKLINPLKSYI